MAEYIDREEALKQAFVLREDEECGCSVEVVLVNAIKKIPASDVVEVVKCKDCKFYNNHGMKDVVFDGDACHWNADEQPDPDDFCSAGERREE